MKKRILTLALAALMVLGATTAASAATKNTGKITGMACDLSYGYSGDSDLGEIAPQDERVEYISLTDDMFTWDDDYSPVATPSTLTSAQIRSAKLTARATNSKVLDSVTVNSRESRIEVKFLDELAGVKEQDFDFDVILSIGGRQQRDYAMSFSGTFANPVMEVYADTDYADISEGYVVEAMEYVRAIDLDVGDGVLVHTKLSIGRKYYGVAHHIPYDDADAFMKAHPTVVEAISLKTVGLANAASTVTLGDGLGAVHVYNKDGEYLGLGSDELIYVDTYYLSKEKLEAAEPEVPGEPIPSDVPTAPPVPEPVPVADSYPPNVNYNPNTGGC